SELGWEGRSRVRTSWPACLPVVCAARKGAAIPAIIAIVPRKQAYLPLIGPLFAFECDRPLRFNSLRVPRRDSNAALGARERFGRPFLTAAIFHSRRLKLPRYQRAKTAAPIPISTCHQWLIQCR